jgi:hypothetical protein
VGARPASHGVNQQKNTKNTAKSSEKTCKKTQKTGEKTTKQREKVNEWMRECVDENRINAFTHERIYALTGEASASAKHNLKKQSQFGGKRM